MDPTDRELAADDPVETLPPSDVEAVESPSAAEEAPPESPAAIRPSRGRRWFSRVRSVVHLPRTRRGIVALLLVIGAFGSFFIVGAVQVVAWTETADFCGRCHTMGPELTAHANGPHSDLSCGECHVEPGVNGWVKAKMNGTRQLIEIVLGTFPEPIPPPDHDALPPPSETCQRCHSLDRVGTAALLTRTQFTADEANTRQFVGLLIRPSGGDPFNVARSVHWHVLADVEFRADDASAQAIRWVGVTQKNGTVKEFIRQDEVRVTEDVRPDLERIKSESPTHRVDCITCHNRVGHPLPSPRKELDAALSRGLIDPDLPFIKREGMRILWSSFATIDGADAEIDRLSNFYARNYPQVAKNNQVAIDVAIQEIKVLYRLTATPVMRVTASTYPDNLGHTDFVGCFRCHDGGHFLIKDGAVTKQTIPSSCDTCHTFPQIGAAIASLPLGVPPDTHDDRLWVFNHRLTAPDIDSGTASCGECHARDYCTNCHKTGAVTVDHDEMLTNHAKAVRQSGSEACAYCHQPVYCARCHREPVLPGSAPGNTGASEGPSGLEWRLIPTAARQSTRGDS